MDPGFAISGLVIGHSGNGTSDTLELASAASAGTVTGLGTEFIGFSSIVFDPGAEWSITNLPRGFAATIAGFAPGDTIDVAGVVVDGTPTLAGC